MFPYVWRRCRRYRYRRAVAELLILVQCHSSGAWRGQVTASVLGDLVAEGLGDGRQADQIGHSVGVVLKSNASCENFFLG